jgi:flagellar basal-body rod protein FlgF
MDRSLFVAMSGAKQILQAQAANANNLANVNSTAFRADLEQFRSQPVFGPGHPSRVYAMLERPGVDLSAGSIQSTGRELDVAVNGDGWIAVKARDGVEAYTRAGDLHVTPQGQLLTHDGLSVLGNNGPITVPPSQRIEIGVDGTLSVIPQGGNATTLAAVDRIKLVKPPKDQLEKGGDGLMRVAGGNPIPPDAAVRLVPGALESSNVSAVEEMTQMIQLQRQYEMQLKLMKTVEENGAAGSRLMQIG